MRYVASSPIFDHWTPLFTVLLGTGCRIGEIIGLRWEDVDYEKRSININHSITVLSTKRRYLSVPMPGIYAQNKIWN